MNVALRGAKVQSVPLELPGTGLSLGRVGIRAAAVKLRPAPSGKVGFRTELRLGSGSRSVARLHLDAEVAPVVDPKAGTVSIALGPDNLRQVVPQMEPAASRALAGFIHGRLPPAARMMVSKSDLANAADDIVAELFRRSWPRIRDSVLADVGQVTSLEFALPDVPLRDVAIRSRAGALDLLVDTGLPVARGVTGTPTASGDRVVLRATGEAVAAMANVAIKTGRIPARYDLAGEPNPKGPFVVGLGWEPGPRPLQLHAWAEEGDCAYLRISGTPQLAVKGKSLEVSVQDGRIDEARGPTKLRLAAFSQRVGRNALTFVHQETARFELDLAGRPLVAHVVDVRTQGGDIETQLSIAPGR